MSRTRVARKALSADGSESNRRAPALGLNKYLGAGRPAGPYLMMMEAELLLCPGCRAPTASGEHQAPVMSPTAPALVGYDYNTHSFFPMVGHAIARKAWMEGRYQAPVLLFNVGSYLEGLARALESEIPLRGRPVLEVTQLYEGYLAVSSEFLPLEASRVHRRGLSIVDALRNLSKDGRALLTQGAVTETASVSIAGIADKTAQYLMTKEAIKKGWSLKHLQKQILARCALHYPTTTTLRIWKSMPATNGRVVSKFDYPSHPDDPDSTPSTKEGPDA